MTAKKALIGFLTFTLILITLVMAFNFYVDPLCVYCQEIDPHKKTLNSFYKIAQLIVRNPDVEQLVFGSSRGETTSAIWLQQQSGLKTLNLSSASAEVFAKKIFLNLALEKTKLKRVLWFADYFELMQSSIDHKVKDTQVFQKYIEADHPVVFSYSRWVNELQRLIDHNTIEASFATFKKEPESVSQLGSGSEINYQDCARPEFIGNMKASELKSQIDLIYTSYVGGLLKGKQSDQAWKALKDLFHDLSHRNISVLIVIPPYHPLFMQKLKEEHADIYQAHLDWIKAIENLKSPKIEVLNFFAGIPGDDGSPRFWNDGSHFTCKSVLEIFKSLGNLAR